ncbi:hypothetical protein [Streptomyces wuyuanensis]|uniref:hypothetical protein n=1 Tax=Streptomyces wuyuanensis TaxID=1196353 RepID=UPI003436592E
MTIRLPSNHAAITAPLVTYNTVFPGIPIGRSLLDGRAFHLSPVLTPAAVLPSTNSLALGGLGSGKSTTAKTRIHRETLHHNHQTVVIDSFGEDNTGEWAPLTRSLGGRVIEAGSFTLNPCSELFPPEVREQLIRSLIATVEPGALNHQATHALQHALNHPKATDLNGLVDALVRPEAGRWPATKLTEWGEGAAIALSRYTEGSLQGLFDGPDAGLPETDLPILSFDLSRLDRNSPAIPALMAAISCWAEHVWLRQSTAVHRHLVLEEAWQILLSPATSQLIQRLLKNSRKAGLSLDVIMHTLSDLGDGRAQDLARLCEVAHIGRLGPEEAAHVGALLGLPAWAVEKIPTLDPGQAVWKVGPDHVDIIQTVLDDEEIRLTDTSSRRRRAQKALVQATTVGHTATVAAPETDSDDHQGEEPPASVEQEANSPDSQENWNWNMPPNVIDIRHHHVLQAALAGRCGEAAELAAIGEREDITAHGINSDQAVSWLATRARVADLCGSPDQAIQLRATVARIGKDVEWFENTSNGTEPEWHRGSQPEPTTRDLPEPAAPKHRRLWPYAAVIAALTIAAAGVWQTAEDEHHTQERREQAAPYKGRSGAELHIDGVTADVRARWAQDGKNVILQLVAPGEVGAKYLRIDAAGQSAIGEWKTGHPVPPELVLPVNDPHAEVTVRVSIGGNTWKEGSRATSQTVRLSPTGAAFDADTGKTLPPDDPIF